MSELERRVLKSEVLARGGGEDKSKVDVDDVAFRVQEDVPIVSESHAINISLYILRVYY